MSEIVVISRTQIHTNILKHQPCGDLLQMLPHKKK